SRNNQDSRMFFRSWIYARESNGARKSKFQFLISVSPRSLAFDGYPCGVGELSGDVLSSVGGMKGVAVGGGGGGGGESIGCGDASVFGVVSIFGELFTAFGLALDRDSEDDDVCFESFDLGSGTKCTETGFG